MNPSISSISKCRRPAWSRSASISRTRISPRSPRQWARKASASKSRAVRNAADRETLIRQPQVLSHEPAFADPAGFSFCTRGAASWHADSLLLPSWERISADDSVLKSRVDHAARNFVLPQLKDPEAFVAKIQAIHFGNDS